MRVGSRFLKIMLHYLVKVTGSFISFSFLAALAQFPVFIVYFLFLYDVSSTSSTIINIFCESVTQVIHYCPRGV